MARRTPTRSRRSTTAPADWTKRPEYVEGYTFDAEAADRPCQFIERFCRHPADDGGPATPVTLLPWVRARLIHPLFGWKREDGRLRYRRGAVFVPKKNRKTSTMAALAQYMMCSHFPIADVYPAAVDREQARLLYRMMARSVTASPQLSAMLEVIDSKSIIRNREHGNVLRCLSADAWRNEGLNGSVIIDEIHAHRSPSLVDALTYATRGTRNGLVLTISTAGADRNSIGYQWWKDAELVMKNPAANPTFFGLIYAADPEDDFDDPAVWRKANPSMGIAFAEDEFRDDWQDSLTNPRKRSQWLRYSLNVWVESDDRWFTGDSWEQCGAGPASPTDGRPCWIGVDLSSNVDMTSAAIVWKEPDGGYYVEWRYWVPRETVAERERVDRIPYSGWIRDGFVTVTDGARLDHEKVAADLIELSRKYEVRGVGVDPWQAGALETLLQREGIEVRDIAQRTAYLNAPCKLLEALVVEKRLRHGGNPVAAWNANHVCVYTDPTGLIKPDKAKSREKIDGIAALVNALALASTDESGTGDPSEYRMYEL